MLLLLNFIGITEKSEGGNNERIVQARDTIRHWPRCVLAHSDTTTLEQECFAVGCLPTVAVPDTRCQNRGGLPTGGECLRTGGECLTHNSPGMDHTPWGDQDWPWDQRQEVTSYTPSPSEQNDRPLNVRRLWKISFPCGRQKRYICWRRFSRLFKPVLFMTVQRSLTDTSNKSACQHSIFRLKMNHKNQNLPVNPDTETCFSMGASILNSVLWDLRMLIIISWLGKKKNFSFWRIRDYLPILALVIGM